ncbi:MAG TPA: hypothetical protein QF646_05985 [Candidatus Poseidoniales archaeon]|nr:hypothetical protein [Candidatus Poseidoniales archaeon]
MGRSNAPQDPPAWLSLPSTRVGKDAVPELRLQDLAAMHPSPPIPLDDGEIVVHRARLHDPTGLGLLLDWVAEGDIVIVEMKDVMRRTVELDAALSQLVRFIVDDTGGQILQLGEDRLLLLPASLTAIESAEVDGE